jgi:branched-chain amino acid transport system ATP-binding protein
MSQPKLLHLDEPSAGLSPIYVRQVFDQVKRINHSGVGVLMVEQNARHALAFASRGFVIVNGRNRLDGTGPGLLANPDVGRAFLGG